MGSTGRRTAQRNHCVVRIIIVAVGVVLAGIAGVGYPIVDVAAAQEIVPEECPAEGIALFSRLALDQGRRAEHFAHAKFIQRLMNIAVQSDTLERIVEQSTADFAQFSKELQGDGNDITPGDLLVDLETLFNELRRLNPGTRFIRRGLSLFSRFSLK